MRLQYLAVLSGSPTNSVAACPAADIKHPLYYAKAH